LVEISRPIALLDWDNSLRGGWLIVDWANALTKDALFPTPTNVHLHGLVQRYTASELTYDLFVEETLSTFAEGLSEASVDAIQRHASDFASREVMVRPFAAKLLADLNARAIDTIFVSGAPQVLLIGLRDRYGASAAHGTTFETRRGVYTGSVRANMALREAKDLVVRGLLARGAEIAVALGDSKSDLPMLEAAIVPIVVENRDLSETLPNSVLLQADAPATAVDECLARL
jgi:HAD superfamily phosphoserine phosphatase-like hydrolase